uniref:Uncharacterized protein n=1 Tax=Solanum lycopersicum TaxID=4081 RepID=A0A3Q7FT25_SOLLC
MSISCPLSPGMFFSSINSLSVYKVKLLTGISCVELQEKGRQYSSNTAYVHHWKKSGRGYYERTSTSKTGTRRGAGSGYKKRPKVVGQGVFVADTGYTCINQGLSSRRRVNTSV